MNDLIFKIYLSMWQRLPIGVQNFFSEIIRKISFNSDTLKPNLPNVAIIDPINICNLECPLCASKTQDYNKSKMSNEDLVTYLGKLPSVKVIVLFNWGEPFLNKDIFKMINEIVKRNIYSIIHTNFSFVQKEEFFNEIINSGLHQLIISCDGATQESYEKYRVKGNIELVFNNMRTLTRIKKQNKKRDPKIIWKYLVNKYNENEIEMAKKIAKEIGIEIFFDKMGLSDDLPDIQFPKTISERKNEWLPKEKKYIQQYYLNEQKGTIFNSACNQLFQSIVINPDGKITPCCWITSKENIWGDLKTQSLKDIWYTDNYSYSRSLFNNLEYGGKVKKNICSDCIIFKGNIEL